MNRGLKPLLVGLATIAVLVGGVSAAKDLGGQDPVTVTAYFPDSAGLFTGNDVGILGVPVGTVTKIRPDGGRVAVTLRIDGDHAVPADAGAVVVARSVATDRYVELTPVYHGGAKLADGDVIAEDRTRTPVEFDEVLATVNDFATKIGGNKQTADAVRRIVDSGAAALDGRGAQLHDTIGALGDATSTLSGQREDFSRTLTSLDALVRLIATNEGTERRFITQVADASTLLASEREEFRRALRALDRAVTSVAGFSVRNRAELVKALDGSAQLMTTVSGKQQQLSEILEVLPVALENLRRADHNGAVPARLDPLVLAPLGGLLTQVCERLPLNLCETLDGTGTVGDLVAGLGDVLGLPGLRRGSPAGGAR